MNPWLRCDKTWKDFMCSTSTIPVSKVEDNPSFAEDMLFGMLDTLCVPSSPLERVCILKDELNHIEKQRMCCCLVCILLTLCSEVDFGVISSNAIRNV